MMEKYRLTEALRSTFFFLMLCLAYPVMAQGVNSSNDSIKWNQWVDQAYADANTDNIGTHEGEKVL